MARRSDGMSRLFVCSLGRRGTKLTLQMKASTLLRPRGLQPSAASAAWCAQAPSGATCRSMWMVLLFGLGDCHSLRWESLLVIGLLVPACVLRAFRRTYARLMSLRCRRAAPILRSGLRDESYRRSVRLSIAVRHFTRRARQLLIEVAIGMCVLRAFRRTYARLMSLRCRRAAPSLRPRPRERVVLASSTAVHSRSAFHKAGTSALHRGGDWDVRPRHPRARW